jgi:hypothetical protein
MSKRQFILFLFLVIIFSSFVSADLVENSTWQQNLSSLSAHVTIIFGDIDNDDDLDMIQIGCGDGDPLTCSSAGKSYVYANNGTSLVENQTWQQNLTTTKSASIALGDIDNDGDLDLILAATFTKIYENNGTTFNENSTWQNYITGEDGASSGSVNLGDIDNDGDLDIVMMDMGDTSKSVWINNGTTFINSTIWGQDAREDSRASSALVDFDNDGDLDSFVGGYDHGSIYINNGTTLELSSIWGGVAGDHVSVAIGDVDNDGDMDMFGMRLAGACGGSDIFFENNGSMMIRNTTYEDSLISLFFGSATFGDYDNNGFLDLVINGQCGGTPYIFVYDKNGSGFTYNNSITAALSASQSGSVVWADLDNDNKLDLINIKPLEIYINNITTPNQEPTSPDGFSSYYKDREIALGWLNGSDAETNSTGLYYNLMIGDASANHTIVSGIYGGQGDVSGGGGIAFGYYGNMMQRKNFTLHVDRLSPSTTYYWYVQTIDTGLKAGNWSTVQNFTTPADMERPNITLNSPVNNANSSSYNLVFNVTVFDNMNLSNVSLWGNWTGTWHLNETNSSGINNTNYIFTKNLTSYGDGSYIWMIQAEDNETNIQNSSIRTFIIDTTGPSITIVSPTNGTNSSDTGLDVNYTASDSGVGLDSCWYSNDTYSVNTTISCGTNITTLNWSEGSHNVTVWANDSSGNENSSSVSFTIDITNPIVIITNPLNNTNTTNTGLNITYTVTDTYLDSCWYSNDTYSVNTSLGSGGSCINITTVTWGEGQHNVTVWANDSAGNEGQNSTLFTIDTTGPSVTIVSPTNGTNSSNTELNVTYTASDSGVGLESCWYSNDTYSVNTSITCGTNLTTLNWSDMTTHNVTIWANDTLGNEGQDIVFFTINTTDVTAPIVTLISPVNSKSYTSNSQEITFNYNITEKNEISNCSLIIDGSISLTNSSINKLEAQNFTKAFSPATHTWKVNCTDTNNNVGNSSVRSFTVTAPVSPPGNGGGSSTSGFWTNTYSVSDNDFERGYVKELGKKQRVRVSVNDEIHYIGVVELTDITATINITSNPIQVVLSIGEEARVDILDDGFYDIYVLLDGIVNEKANLVIQSIHEEIPEGEEAVVISGEEVEEEERDRIWLIVVIWLVVAVIIIVFLSRYFLERHQNRFNNKIKVVKKKMGNKIILIKKNKRKKWGKGKRKNG